MGFCQDFKDNYARLQEEQRVKEQRVKEQRVKEGPPYKKTNHLIHFIAAVIFFPWLLIWVICAYTNRSHNDALDRQIWMSKQTAKYIDADNEYTEE